MKRKTVNLKDMTPEQRKEYKKAWAKEYYQKNKAELNKKTNEYYHKNKAKLNKKANEYYHKNKDKRAESMAKYKKENKDKWNKYQRDYKREKYAEMTPEQKKEFIAHTNPNAYSYQIRKKMMDKINEHIENLVENADDSNLVFEFGRYKNETMDLTIRVKDSSKSYSYTRRKNILNHVFDVTKTEIINGHSDKIELSMAKGNGDININLGIKK